jgi:integrase
VQACQGHEGYHGPHTRLHVQADLASLILLTDATHTLPHLRNLSLQLPLYAVAEAAAVCVLLDSLRSHPSLTSLSIQLGSRREYIQLLRTRGGLPALQMQHWSPCLRALGQFGGEHALSLRRITLRTAPSAVSPEDVSTLQAALAEREARDACRLAVLMGTHCRLGARCGIRWAGD